MGRILPFSFKFPDYHYLKGQPTNFWGKLWAWRNRVDPEESAYQDYYMDAYSDYIGQQPAIYNLEPKGQTVRGSEFWKEGMIVSPRMWSGRPYHSVNFAIMSDILIERVIPIQIAQEGRESIIILDGNEIHRARNDDPSADGLEDLLKLEGLDAQQFKSWMRWWEPFKGQVLQFGIPDKKPKNAAK